MKILIVDDEQVALTSVRRILRRQGYSNVEMCAAGQEAIEKIKKIKLILDDSFSIDRTGISLLMEAIQQLKQKDISVIIENLSYNYARVFQMAGMDKMATLIEAVVEE